MLPRPEESFGHLEKILQDYELSLGLDLSRRDFPLTCSSVRAQTPAVLCDLGRSLDPRNPNSPIYTIIVPILHMGKLSLRGEVGFLFVCLMMTSKKTIAGSQ